MKLHRSSDLARMQWAVAMVVFALFALFAIVFEPATITRAVATVFDTAPEVKLCDVANASECSCQIPAPPRAAFPWEKQS